MRQIKDTNPTTYLMPQPLLRATSMNFTLDHIEHSTDSRKEKVYWGEDDGPWLCGFRLPPFQRPAVWSCAQQVRFLESAWLGLHLGTYVVNRVDRWDHRLDKPHHMDLWLIDGQQRLRALSAYWQDEFPIFGHVWSALDKAERRRFGSYTFTQSVVHVEDEALARELYNRMNFGGTPHVEGQRA